MEATKKLLKIGWMGTGVMGKSMAGHLMKHGYTLTVYNRTPSKTDELVANGAIFKNPIDIAKESDVVFLMLGYPHDVEEVVFNDRTGILQHMKSGSYLIDHTTSSPKLAQRIYEEAMKRGVKSIDAPVSGGDIGAKNGKLVTMVGGDKEAVDAVMDLLMCYSIEVQLLGDAGAGQHTKAANQIMIANNMMGVVEGLLYGHKAGLDLNKLINLLSKGAASSFSLEKLGPRMLRRDFDPGFYVEHFVKDLGIALEESRRMQIGLPGMAQACQFYQAMMGQGGAKMGTQGLLQILEKFNGTEIKKYDI